MAGFRTFATGEVLTAANVNNFLMKQSVMVFADAAARTAALGAEVVEGMLTYNEDTAQLEVFDGAAFIAARAAGIGSNAVYVNGGATFTTTAGSFVNDTGLTVDITPTSATSRILMLWTARIDSQGPADVGIKGRRTVGGTTTGWGETSGMDLKTLNALSTITFIGVDSPGTTSTVTYGAQISSSNGRILSTRNITVIEVAA